MKVFATALYVGSLPLAGYIGYLIGVRCMKRSISTVREMAEQETQEAEDDNNIRFFQRANQRLNNLLAQNELSLATNAHGEVENNLCAPEVCQLLCKIVSTPDFKIVFELGAFTGLTTLNLALAAGEQSIIVACEENDYLKIGFSYFVQVDVAKRIKIINRPYEEVVSQLHSRDLEELYFDMVIIYAHIRLPLRYYETLLTALNKGGIIAIDGMFPVSDAVPGAVSDAVPDAVKDTLSGASGNAVLDKDAGEQLVPVRDVNPMVAEAQDRLKLKEKMLADKRIKVAMVHIGKGLIIAVKL